jgi:hypothetical protein
MLIKRKKRKSEILIKDFSKFRKKNMMNQLLFLREEVKNNYYMRKNKHPNLLKGNIGIQKLEMTYFQKSKKKILCNLKLFWQTKTKLL